MWWAFGSMFGAGLALVVMPTLGWHWYLGLAATPLVLVLVFFPVCCYYCVFVSVVGRGGVPIPEIDGNLC